MDGKKPTILYIAGWDRSGSTILDQILGQIPRWFSVGELVDLWDRGPCSLCGCGRVFKDCDLWQQVFLRAFQVSPDRFDFSTVSALRRRCARSRHLFLLPNPFTRGLVNPALDAYIAITRKLYQAISAITGARVLVDSSKQPVHAYILNLTEAADLFVVHLVRDPRGCAYSWLNNKPHPDPAIAEFPRLHPARTSLNWVFANTATKALWSSSKERYLVLRYEDFIARPEDNVSRIMEFVRQPASHFPFLSHHSAALRPTHGVSGNSVRFDTGTVQLKLDEKWRTGMKPVHKLLVTALTGVMLPKYGYRCGSIWRTGTGRSEIVAGVRE